MRPLVIAALAAIALGACSRDEAKRTAPTSVAMTRLAFVDADRDAWSAKGPRPLAVTVWHPAAERATAPAVVVPAEKPIFVGGFAQTDGAPEPGVHPLVVLSHGTGGSAFQMMWLARRLAEAGYIAAAVDHHGNSAAEAAFDPRGFRMPWERARDQSAVIDRLLADKTFGPLIDRDRIAAAGFSLGGFTALQLVGARADPGVFAAFCGSAEADATCGPQREFPEAEAKFQELVAEDPRLAARQADARDSFRDPRIKAAIALAPAPGQMLTAESLFSISVPVLIFVGAADKIAPAAGNAAHIEGLVAKARLEKIDGAGHYVFLNACTKGGVRALAVCRDAAGVERAAVHDRVAADIVKFLDGALRRAP